MKKQPEECVIGGTTNYRGKNRMKNLIKFILIISLYSIHGCKDSKTEDKNKDRKSSNIWISRNIGSFSIQVPDNYKIQYLYDDCASGIIGNENVKINFTIGYSPIVFENRPEQVVLGVDTNETIITRITKFKMNNVLTLATEVWDTSKNGDLSFKDFKKDFGYEGLELYTSDFNADNEEVLLTIFSSTSKR